jgi:hypothetical protein
MKLTLTAVLRKDKVNSSNQHPIVIRVSYANEKSRVGLGYSLEAHKWEAATESPNKQCEEKLKREINKNIGEVKERIEETFRSYYQKEGEYPSHPQLLALLKENKGKKYNSTTFNKLIVREYKEFIRERKVNIATYKAYNSTLVKLEEFLESYKLGSYKELNDRFHNTFISMLEKQHYRAGTIGKYTKNIKAFLNHLAKQGKINPTQYRDFKINKEYQTKPSLELSDIMIMKYALGLEQNAQYNKLKITLTPEEKNILIVYLWLCGTGQSFIDYKSITNTNITKHIGNEGTEHLVVSYDRIKNNKPNEVIVVLTQELLDLLIFYYQQFDFGKETFAEFDKKHFSKPLNKKLTPSIQAVIPETKYVLSVMKFNLLQMRFSKLKKEVSHYPYLIPQFSMQYYNRAIKKVAEKIGITQKVSSSVKWGGRLDKPRLDRKCDLLSSHLCRKYFIETNRALGVSYEEVMIRTGIRSMNTLLRYNKISKEHLILNTIKLPTQSVNKGLMDSITFNIGLNTNSKKNTTPSRYSQINKKSKNGFSLQVEKKKK